MISLGWGWQARAWSDVFVAIVAFPIAIYFLRRDYALKWHFDIASLEKMLRFSSPLLLTSMLSYVLISADRLFIAEMVGSQELGLYTVAVQLASAMGMFIGAALPTGSLGYIPLKVESIATTQEMCFAVFLRLSYFLWL